MRWLLITEQVAQFALAIFLIYLSEVHLSWWLWALLFFSPDIGMIGYLINTRVGAFTYNLLHHKAIAIAVLAFGYFTGDDRVMVAGLLLFAHSSFDRVFGYGLKYSDSFKHTHLGRMK